MRNFRIDIQYDGTNYCGWQIQNNGITIQEEIEKALFKLNKEKHRIVGSGRTDAGVHAIHQVASFKSNINIPIEKIPLALNSYLPQDIRITKSFYVNENFCARYSAVKRTYKYVINDFNILSPFDRFYVYHRKKKIDEKKLLKIINSIKGIHNFKNLCCQKDESKNKIREIYDINIERNNNYINIFITANAFLRKMVRIIIGTAIKTIEHNLDDNNLIKILNKDFRSDSIYTAPSQGLYLYKVEY